MGLVVQSGSFQVALDRFLFEFDPSFFAGKLFSLRRIGWSVLALFPLALLLPAVPPVLHRVVDVSLAF